MSLFNVAEVVTAHHKSLVDRDHSRPRVLATIYGPFVVVVVAVVAADVAFPDDVQLGSGIGESLAAAFALLAGILFGLSLTVLNKAIDMDLIGPRRVRTLTERQTGSKHLQPTRYTCPSSPVWPRLC